MWDLRHIFPIFWHFRDQTTNQLIEKMFNWLIEYEKSLVEALVVAKIGSNINELQTQNADRDNKIMNDCILKTTFTALKNHAVAF